LKDEDVFKPDMLTESAEVGQLTLRDDYHLRRILEQNFDEDGEIKVYREKSLVTNVKQNSIGYGIIIYEGRIGEDKILFTAEDVY
jgi:hypothetical protein